jgi:hypothetical protein
MDDLFSLLERELKDPIPDRSIRAFWRNVVRPKLVPKTITTHNGELHSVLRRPWGCSWVKVNEKEWCPICGSISPVTLLDFFGKVQIWNPASSIVEYHRLIAQGEMDPSSPVDIYEPMVGTAYGMYGFDGDNEPVSFTLVANSFRHTISIQHIYDLDQYRMSRFIQHMNRLSPVVHWTLCRGNHLHWALAAYAPGLVMESTFGEVVEDPDDDETDTDPGEPSPPE